MTPKQICQLLEDDYLQFLPLEGRLLAQRVEEGAVIYLFEYAEMLIEVFFALGDGTLMGSAQLQNRKRLKAYKGQPIATR